MPLHSMFFNVFQFSVLICHLFGSENVNASLMHPPSIWPAMNTNCSEKVNANTVNKKSIFQKRLCVYAI